MHWRNNATHVISRTVITISWISGIREQLKHGVKHILSNKHIRLFNFVSLILDR